MEIDTAMLSTDAVSQPQQEVILTPAIANSSAYQKQDSTPGPPSTKEQLEDLRKRIVAALCTCYDPEIPVNIFELGLIYNVEMATSGSVTVFMTLTSPACPVAGTLPGEVQRKLQSVAGVTSAKVEIVWDPPWDKSRMSEAAKLQLGIED